MSGWLQRRMDAQTEGLRDGEAEELERAAGETATATPVRARAARGAATDPAASRRAVIEAALAEKVLRSHLHNNLQTSFPLVLNLANQSAEEAAILAEVAAAAATSDANGGSRTRTADILATAGAGPDVLAGLDASLAAPRPLPELMAALAERGLAAYAYAVALLVLPRPSAAEEAFLLYLSARLDLGADAVAGINQRYRR